MSESLSRKPLLNQDSKTFSDHSSSKIKKKKSSDSFENLQLHHPVRTAFRGNDSEGVSHASANILVLLGSNTSFHRGTNLSKAEHPRTSIRIARLSICN